MAPETQAIVVAAKAAYEAFSTPSHPGVDPERERKARAAWAALVQLAANLGVNLPHSEYAAWVRRNETF